MIIKNSRAQRRHDRARLKKIRSQYWSYNGMGTPRLNGMVINTPTPCSCPMCGNPRRHGYVDHPLTMQERKALESFEDQINND